VPIAEYFSEDHRKVEMLLESLLKSLQDQPKAQRAFEELERLLHKHIYCEEELLFPEVEARGLSGPTDVMRSEHGQISGLLAAIQKSLREGNMTIKTFIDGLKDILAAHDLKEEGVLYPAADSMIEHESAKALLERVRNAVSPKDWKCRALRPK